MSYIKQLVIALIIVPAVVFLGCESNDALQPVSSAPPNTDSVSKKVMVEFFTNAGCNPCIAAHGYLDGITSLSGVTNNDTNVIIVSYHTKYPYIGDIIYLANIPQNQGRSDYYGINFTPQGRLDGVNMNQFSSSEWTGQINAELNTTIYVDIALTNTYNPNTDSGSVTANLTLVNAMPVTDNVLHVLITENNVPYPNAPNGITSPDDVMRNMITGVNGQAITIGQNTTVTKPYVISTNWNEDECFITVFVQNPATKAVFGVERIKVKQ
jgi:Outer membrane protein Omp28